MMDGWSFDLLHNEDEAINTGSMVKISFYIIKKIRVSYHCKSDDLMSYKIMMDQRNKTNATWYPIVLCSIFQIFFVRTPCLIKSMSLLMLFFSRSMTSSFIPLHWFYSIPFHCFLQNKIEHSFLIWQMLWMMVGGFEKIKLIKREAYLIYWIHNM